MPFRQEAAVANVSLEQAIKLLQAADRAKIEHVVSVIRDPSDPTRILSITASEAR